MSLSDDASRLVQPTLMGTRVTLRPLTETDGPALVQAAGDGRLWEMTVTVIPGPDSVDGYLATALKGRDAGTVMPFLILDSVTGAPIGSTRFWKIDRVNRKLEIGHTWLGLSTQRTGANTEAKYLLLTHAFETLNSVRVQFTTDELNEKSRAAILRLGAVQEGIVRHERIMPDGRKRNSVRYSIIDDEWPDVKRRLEARMGAGSALATG